LGTCAGPRNVGAGSMSARHTRAGSSAQPSVRATWSPVARARTLCPPRRSSGRRAINWRAVCHERLKPDANW